MLSNYRLKIRSQTHGDGILYLIFVMLICLTCVVGAGIFLAPMSWFHWLFVGGSIVFSNFVEYMLHRFPLHRPLGPLKGVYKKHAGLHHRYFTADNMGIDDKKDIFHVITSFKVILLFFGFIITPISLLCGLIATQFGILFFMTSMSYYLIYELTHLICHWKPNSFLTRLPYFKGRVENHRLHHDSKQMRESRFNVSFSLMDWIFKT